VEEQEQSWVESSYCPQEAWVVNGGEKGGSVEEEDGEVGADLLLGQFQELEDRVQVDGDGALDIG
ncbi:hypothetical protein A2U01_0116493, partial [Trifolium medium]|nr:hypothetical protein [Trifolium medium]